MSYTKPMNVFSAGSGISGMQGKSLLAGAQSEMAKMMQNGSAAGKEAEFAKMLRQDPQNVLAAGMQKLQSSGALGPMAGVGSHPDVHMAGGGARAASIGKVLEHSVSPLRTLNSLQTPDKKPAAKTPEATAQEQNNAVQAAINAASKFLGLENGALAAESNPDDVKGVLSEKFESGGKGISAIGYDSNGGTSYGKFQIASKPGSMQNFIKYLTDEAPDLAERLKAAGPANTGGRRGKMPAEWQEIATEQPERFEKLQDDFIKQSHFMPALEAIAQHTGMIVNNLGEAFKEVLFSTAVQHGPAGAARIFAKAIGKVGQDKLTAEGDPKAAGKAGEDLIKQVYSLRSSQFGSSTPEVQSSVKSRLRSEMNLALNMFRGDSLA